MVLRSRSVFFLLVGSSALPQMVLEVLEILLLLLNTGMFIVAGRYMRFA